MHAGPDAARPGSRAQRAMAIAVVALTMAVTPLALLRRGGTPDVDAATGPATTSPGQAGPAVEFDIVATGDILVHPTVFRRALAYGGGSRYDFTPMFAELRPIVSGADLAICHLEGTLGRGDPSGPGGEADPAILRAPTEVADAIAWTGWDLCDTASNHSLDYAQQGVDDTLAAFDAAGIPTTGSARSAAEAGRILTTTVKGVRVAYLAYTYGTNGIPLPNPWSVHVISLPDIEADAARAREEGADLVVVNFHWGTQYQHEPDAEQDQLADELLSKGTVDLILGQHVHVVQPIERRFGRYVVFGEGNLVANQEHDELARHDGLVVVAHVRAEDGRAAVTSVRYVPTWNFAPDFVVVPIPSRLAELEAEGAGGSAEAEVLGASFDRTVGYAGTGPGIGPLGRPEPVVTGSP